MLVIFEGRTRHKAFHDPGTKTIDLWSADARAEGNAFALGEALVVVCDDEGAFGHLSLDYSSLSLDGVLPNCPEECPTATIADLELTESDCLQALVDSAEGTMRLSFGERIPVQWARLGENLLWLGLDSTGCLASMMVRGISRDAGGKAQNAWLAEVGIG